MSHFLQGVIAQNSDGRLALVIHGEDGTLHTAAQIAPNGDFGAWQQLGGPWPVASRPVFGRNADGRLEIFVCGEDRNLYHTWQVTAGGEFGGWQGLGGPWQ